jgi:hypothetical protein
LITALFTFPFLFSSAQEDIAKNFRFGLMGNTSVGWLSPDDERKFSSAGVGLGLGWGLQMEFKLGKTTSLVTGLNLESFSAKLNYYPVELETAKPTYYALDANQDYEVWNELSPPIDSLNVGQTYQLKERKYKINYVNLPFILKMKTKEIGYFTYFGEFGGVVGFKTKARAEDISDQVDYSDTISSFVLVTNGISSDERDIAKGTQPIRAGIRVGAGAEYNISGSTSLFFSLHYNYFITNALTRSASEKYLRSYNSDTGQFEAVGAKAIPGSVSLTVGVLF